MARRECPVGHWKMVFEAPCCTKCKPISSILRILTVAARIGSAAAVAKLISVALQSYRRRLLCKTISCMVGAASSYWLVPWRAYGKSTITLRVTNDEFVAVDTAYRRAVASRSKESIIHGNLEAATQRSCAKMKDAEAPQVRYILNSYLPFAIAERHVSSSLVALQWVKPGTVEAAASGDVVESMTACGCRGWAHFLKSTIENSPQDPTETQVPVVDPQIGGAVHGTLPDRTQTVVQQGTQIASSPTHKVLFADTVGNVKHAKHERLDSKKREVTFTSEDYAAIRLHVRKMNNVVFTKKAVENALSECGILQEMRSAKWTDSRLENAIINANVMVSETFPITVSIKNEGMPPSKAPRMIIADGDVGQLCALALTTVFEYILFHRFESRCIKHASKQEAMDRVLGELASFADRPHSYVENDGSAWDTTCSYQIMALIEKPIFKNIWDHMLELGWPDDGLEEIHARVNGSKQFRATKKAKQGDSFVFVFDCMQRSGRRPTSSSNFLINLVMDLAAYNPSAEGCLYVKGGRTFTDRWGNKKRKLVLGKEGDDTGNSVCPPLNDSEIEDLKSFWTRGGFNMKMFVRTRVFEFAGWKVPIVDGCLRPDWGVPDFLRNIDSAAITTSKEAQIDFESVAASKFTSYAMSLHKLPTVAQMFQRWADELKPNVDMQQEDVRRLGVVDIESIVTEPPDYARE